MPHLTRSLLPAAKTRGRNCPPPRPAAARRARPAQPRARATFRRHMGRSAQQRPSPRRQRYFRARGHAHSQHHRQHRYQNWQQSARRQNRWHTRRRRMALLRAFEPPRAFAAVSARAGGANDWLCGQNGQRENHAAAFALRRVFAHRGGQSVFAGEPKSVGSLKTLNLIFRLPQMLKTDAMLKTRARALGSLKPLPTPLRLAGKPCAGR